VKRTLAICCVGHFWVDFACAFLLFRTLRLESDWEELLICYNFCAFAVQMPLGLLADRLGQDHRVAASGTVLVALAYGISGFPWLTAILTGLGNAAFHVGAGLETLSLSRDRAGPLGLFVSPGAIGLFLGVLCGKSTWIPLWALPVILVVTAAALIGTGIPRCAPPLGCEGAKIRAIGVPLLMLLAVVVLRSYVGMSLTFPWKSEGRWALVLTLALAAGKAAGGYLADHFGFLRVAGGSLLLAAILLFGAGNSVCGTAAVFLFNMTMPLTLWAVAQLLPEIRGFAFGLLTFGLFLGFLPVALGAPGLSGSMAAAWALVSLVLLLPGLRKAVGK